MKDIIEIPFGAHDSELKGFEYTIPEGFEAKIKDGKVIVRRKESEDERMIRILKEGLEGLTVFNYTPVDKILSWLEEQKEQKPDTRDADDLQLFGFIYDLLNEIEWKDNWAMSKDECLRRLNDYRPQKPAEWSEEDETMWSNLIGFLEGKVGMLPSGKERYIKWLKERFVKLVYPKPGWKPSEAQMEALEKTVHLSNFGCDADRRNALLSLCSDLQKLM